MLEQKDRLLRWLIGILIAGAVVTGTLLVVYVVQSMRSEQAFNALQARMTTAEQTETTTEQVEAGAQTTTLSPEEIAAAAKAAEDAQTASLLQGLQAMQTENADTVAWLSIPDTKINYPVM